MRDSGIISLLFNRDESALLRLQAKCGRAAKGLASRIVGREDAEEAVNTALLDVWNSVPPDEPEDIEAYFASFARRRAIDMLRAKTRKKRGGDEYLAALDELSEAVPSPVTVEGELEAGLLKDALDGFLAELPEKTRIVFMQRYWWLLPVKEVARENGMSESAVKMQLARTREKLRAYLQKEGFEV